MRNFWLILSIGSFLLTIPISISSYHDYEVVTKGKIVQVVLIEISQSKGFIKFKLNGKVYDKRFNRFLGNSNKIGDLIKMRHFSGNGEYFLLADENPIFIDLFLIIALLFCSGACIYYRVKNVRL